MSERMFTFWWCASLGFVGLGFFFVIYRQVIKNTSRKNPPLEAAACRIIDELQTKGKGRFPRASPDFDTVYRELIVRMPGHHRHDYARATRDAMARYF